MRPVETDAFAFWLREPGVGEIRTVALPEPGPGEVLVRTLYSGVSRGTETLVFRGGVPPSQYQAMRAPFQDGEFPGPVKYGYLSVGMVEAGAARPAGAPCSACFRTRPPTSYPATAVFVVPDGVPPARAVLAGTVETAVNALWDAAPLLGDRIAVVGAGMVGCCVARLLARIPGVRRHAGRRRSGPRRRRRRSGSASRCPGRRRRAAIWSCTPARPERPAAVARACSAPEGDRHRAQLVRRRDGRGVAGGAFHSRRLPSGPARSAWSRRPGGPAGRTADRLALALDLLRDPAFDALLSRKSRVRRAARGDGAAGRREPARAVPRDHLRRGGDPCSA